jgi:hypothetical protein
MGIPSFYIYLEQRNEVVENPFRLDGQEQE